MSKFWNPLTGDPISSAQFRQAFDDVESLTDVAIGQGIISGLGVSSSVGLSLTVASGVAIFAGGHFSFAGASVALANNATNHVYLVSAYQTPTRTYLAELQTNTSGIAPAGSIKLGTVVTSGGSVTVTNFNSSGTRGINLLSLEQLSGMVPNLVSATGSYFPTAATGALVALISQGVSSGAYLTSYEWGQVSGTYLTKSEFAITSGAFGSLSGSFATKLELLAASGSLDTRLVTVENTYVTRTLFNVTSGTVAQLQSQTGTYLLKASSGMFATSGAVAALAAAVSLMYLKTEFASLSGSLYTKAEFASTSGAMFLRSEFAAVSGNFIGINILSAVSGNLIPWTSSGTFQLAGDYATRTEVNSASGLLLTLAQYAATSGTGGGGGGGNYFNLNSLTGNVTLGGSGGISLIQVGQNISFYSPTGVMSFADFNSISGSYALKTQLTQAMSGSIGVVNVKAYGAVGNGVTNDYAAINSAIATGRTVFFPPGTYAIGTGLVVSTNGQCVTGYGATLKKTAHIDALTISSNKCSVVGLNVNGNNFTMAGVVVTGDENIIRDVDSYDNDGFGIVVYGSGVVPGADLNKLEGCRTYSNDYIGIWLRNATDTYMNGCTSQSNGREGLKVEVQSYSLTMVNCHIDDNNHSNTGRPNIYVSESDALSMSACVVTNCLHGGHGIFFDATAASQSGFRLIGSVFAQNAGYGILVGSSGSNSSNTVQVVGCRLNDNTSGTVSIQSLSSGCILVANDFSGVAPSNSGTNTISQANDVGNIPVYSLVVQEADGSPTNTASILKFPNGTLSYSGTEATYTPTAGSSGSLVVEEVDGAPSEVATKLKFPNGTLSYVGTEATYTPSASSSGSFIYAQELDNSPSGSVTLLKFPNNTLTFSGTEATYTPITNSLSGSYFQQFIAPNSFNLVTGTEATSYSKTDVTKYSNNLGINVEWVLSINVPSGSYYLTGPFGLGASFGIVQVLIDNVSVVSNDRYSPSGDTYPVVDLNLGAITEGTHVLSIVCTSKNASSSGRGLVLRGMRLWKYA